MKSSLRIISDLAHQIQKERGCTALYIGSKGKIFKNEAVGQFKVTDKSIKLYLLQNIIWQKNNSFNTCILKKIQSILSELKELLNIRKNILQLSIPASISINNYTYDIIAKLLDVSVEIAFYNKYTYSDAVTGYSNFIYWKERVGRERAIGIRGFLHHSFNNSDFVERMEFLISEQRFYQQAFVELADEKHKKAMEKAMANPATLRVNLLNKKIGNFSSANISLNSMSAEGWYELMTVKMELMLKVEHLLIDSLGTNHNNKNNITNSKEKDLSEDAFPRAINQNIVNSEVYSKIGSNIGIIKNIPLFLGLSEKIIYEILRRSRIKEYTKGQMLFMEGDTPSKFYIVIKGWVKLYKGSVSGEETTIQMLSNGSSVAETAILLDSPYSFSAQTAEDSVLLVLPGSVILQHVQKDNKLAINMLTGISLHSNVLIQHIKSTRLNSPESRVGNFILKLLLEKNWASATLTLPYEKAILASFLNMKPETFSRTLQNLKKEGYKINNREIKLPSMKALCKYCEMDTMLHCTRYNTNFCTFPKLS